MKDLAEILEEELAEAVEVKNRKSLHRYVMLLTEQHVDQQTHQHHYEELRGDIKETIRAMEQGFARMDERFETMQKQMDERFTGLQKQMDERFTGLQKQMDERFAGMQKQSDERFSGLQKHLDERFEASERRFEDINKRFEDMNSRFEDMNTRFEDMNSRFEDMNRRFDDMNDRFHGLQKLMTIGFVALAFIVTVFNVALLIG